MEDWSFGFGDTGDYGITDLDLGSIDWASLGIDPAIFAGLTDTESPGVGTGPPGGGGGIPSIPRIPSIPGMGGGGGGGTSTLDQIARMLTGGNGLAGLIPLIASLYGGISARNATGEAADRVQAAARDASASTQSILGNAGAGFKPYQDAGASALARLSSQAPSNLAAGFQPIQRPNINPGVTAPRFNPLGSGRGLRSIGGM